MAGSDSNFQVVYRSESLTDYAPGELVFFQQPKDNGGGFWLGHLSLQAHSCVAC